MWCVVCESFIFEGYIHMVCVSFKGLTILSGNNMVSSKLCNWVKEYISFNFVRGFGGVRDVMGESDGGKCTGVGVWRLSVVMLWPIIIGVAGAGT